MIIIILYRPTNSYGFYNIMIYIYINIAYLKSIYLKKIPIRENYIVCVCVCACSMLLI